MVTIEVYPYGNDKDTVNFPSIAAWEAYWRDMACFPTEWGTCEPTHIKRLVLTDMDGKTATCDTAFGYKIVCDAEYLVNGTKVYCYVGKDECGNPTLRCCTSDGEILFSGTGTAEPEVLIEKWLSGEYHRRHIIVGDYRF